MDGWDIISAEEIEDLQRMVKETGVKNISDYISRKTKQWKDVHINIAIVGETYVGKSTFINQLRGLKEWDNASHFSPTCKVPTNLSVWATLRSSQLPMKILTMLTWYFGIFQV